MNNPKCQFCQDTGFRTVQDEDGNEVKKLCECTYSGGVNADPDEENGPDIGSGVVVRV